jgi:hypothetical protein
MKFYSLILAAAVLVWNNECHAQLSDIQPLWPNGIPGNPVKYKAEKLTSNTFRQSSLSRSNRVFSCVSEPGYVIHKPENGKANGAAMVICPGGGFSAGGSLSMMVALNMYEKELPGYAYLLKRGAWLKDRGFIAE